MTTTGVAGSAGTFVYTDGHGLVVAAAFNQTDFAEGAHGFLLQTVLPTLARVPEGH